MDRHRDQTDLGKESRKKTSLVATCDVNKGVVVESDDRDAVNVPLDKVDDNNELDLLNQCLSDLADGHKLVYTGDIDGLLKDLLERNHISEQQYSQIYTMYNIS